jgi:hypothetical protein
VTFGDVSYDPSTVLKAVDEIHYDAGFNDYLDSEGVNLDDDKDSEDDD